jgi:hypothetical protein
MIYLSFHTLPSILALSHGLVMPQVLPRREDKAQQDSNLEIL